MNTQELKQHGLIPRQSLWETPLLLDN